MNWNISKVTSEGDILEIIGYDPNLNGRCLKGSIVKTTLEAALGCLGTAEYNEGFGLSVVSSKLVYTIEVLFYTDKEEYASMKEQLSSSIHETKYLNGEYYMGLPCTTFLLWKSMATSNL